jgi:phage protein D
MTTPQPREPPSVPVKHLVYPSPACLAHLADEQAARAAAEARLASLNRGATTLNLTMPGNALIASGSPLSLSGFRDGANGTYHATTVTHTLDDGGYKTTAQGETFKT